MNLKLKEKNSSIKSRKLLKMNLFLISGIVLNNQIFTGSSTKTGSCKGNKNKNNDTFKTYLPKTKPALRHHSDLSNSEYDSVLNEKKKYYNTTSPDLLDNDTDMFTDKKFSSPSNNHTSYHNESEINFENQMRELEEKTQRLEKERLEIEQKEKEKIARIEKEKKEKELIEKTERERREKERLEIEQKEKEKIARIEKEKKEKELIEKTERERREKERIEREEKNKKKLEEEDRIHKEKMEKLEEERKKEEEDSKKKQLKRETEKKVEEFKNYINNLLKKLEFVKEPSGDTVCNDYINYLKNLIEDEMKLRRIVNEGNEENALKQIDKFISDRSNEIDIKKNELIKKANNLMTRNSAIPFDIRRNYDCGNIIWDCTFYTPDKWTNKKIKEVKEAIDEELPQLEQAEKKGRYRQIKQTIDKYKSEYSAINKYYYKEKFEKLFEEVEKKLDTQNRNSNNDLANFESKEIKELKEKLDELKKEYLEQVKKDKRHEEIKQTINNYKYEYRVINNEYFKEKFEKLFEEVENKLDTQNSDFNNNLTNFGSKEIKELKEKLDELKIEHNKYLTKEENNCRNELKNLFKSIKDESKKSELMKLKINLSKNEQVTVQDFINKKEIFKDYYDCEMAKISIQMIYQEHVELTINTSNVPTSTMPTNFIPMTGQPRNGTYNMFNPQSGYGAPMPCYPIYGTAHTMPITQSGYGVPMYGQPGYNNTMTGQH